MFDLETFVPYRITVLASRIAVTFAKQHAERHGLSIPEWRIVAVLGRYGELSSGEVMEKTSMDKAKVSRAVTRLSAAGVIARQDDADDLRRNRLRLSKKGQKIHDKITPIASNLERELLSVLSVREAKTFTRALDKLNQRVLEMTAEDATGNSHL